jgi:hypothetical protein
VVDPTNASTTIGYTRFTDSTHPAYVESALNFGIRPVNPSSGF